MYAYIKGLIEEEKLLFEKLSFDDPFSGNCSIACSGSLALLLYPWLLKHQNQHPKIYVNLKAAPNHQTLSDIKSGHVDQGIVTDVPNESYFDFEKLGQQELCLVFPGKANIQNIGSQLLLKLGLISHPDAEHYLSLYFTNSNEQALKTLDIGKIPIVGSINQIGQILEPVSQGIGFTILPRSAVDSFHSPERLNILRPQQPVMETLYLVCKKNRELPARYEGINSIIREILG